MGASRAEIRRSALLGRQGQREVDAHAFGCRGGEPVADAGLQTAAQRRHQVVGCQRAEGPEECAVTLVGLADDAGTVRLVVESVLEQRLDVGALLLDHEQLGDAACEVPRPFRAEGDGHAHPHQPDAGISHVVVGIEAQALQCLAYLPVGDSRRDDRDPGVGGIDGGVIEPVGGGVRDRQLVADLDDLLLDVDRVRSQQVPVGGMAVRQAVDLWDDRIEPVGVEQDGRGAVGDICHDLQARPQTCRAGHRDGVAAQVERFGRRAGIEHRDVQVGHRPRRTGGDGGALGSRIVAGDGHRAATGISAGEDGMTQRVRGPIDAGCLAVPQADDAVVGGIRPGCRQLAAHDGGGSLILVHRGRVHDRQIGRCPGSLDGGVVAAER